MKTLAIVHHTIEVSIDPQKHYLRAVDRITLVGDDTSLSLYLGKQFNFLEARQGDRSLQIEVEGEDKIVLRYRIVGWEPTDPEIIVSWEGTQDKFTGYGVNIIRPDLVELSGFCSWYPTAETQSQLEQFTYDLSIWLPDHWVIVTPGVEQAGNGGSRRYQYKRPIEDILICASPQFRCERVQGGSSQSELWMYLPPWPEEDITALVSDFSRTAEICERWFGVMRPGNGGVAVVSPRGKEGAEWGYERDGMWVVGDQFARYLLENEWKAQGLKKSLAAHETIHAWFGVGVEFKEPWLAEALTQYLEVIVTGGLFQDPQLPEQYFEWYVGRIEEQLAKEDRPLSEWTIVEDMYVHWYLKGSWAFWDLEACVGREKILEGAARISEKFSGREVTYAEFIEEMEAAVGVSLEAHFKHWFLGSGFKPRYR